ncbi:MAG TPA: hypothetical protein VE545_08060 [Candidatus Dormibacteraeota bacterium]|jgi:hypothetical protein|nr:hypothetical protein [Candidatus Dormibacteraeota bacterium]
MLWSASQKRLSEATKELGTWIDCSSGEKSLATVHALLKVCPSLERSGERRLFAVRIYDRMLCFVARLFQRIMRAESPWIVAERKACAYFAAVLLDQRINRTSQWYAGQVTDSSA